MPKIKAAGFIKLAVAFMMVVLAPAPIRALESVTKVYVPEATVDAGATSIVRVHVLETGKQIKELRAGAGASTAFANADSSEIWVFTADGSTCDVINTSVDRVQASIGVGSRVFEAAFSPDGRYCFAVGRPAGGESVTTILVIDCSNYSVVGRIGGIADPADVVVTPDSRYLYCSSPRQGLIGKIDIESFTIVRTAYAGLEPDDLALSSDGGYLFVACRGLDGGRRGGSQICVLDTRSDDLFWVYSLSTGSPTSIALSSEADQLTVALDTYGLPGRDNLSNFRLTIREDTLSLTKSQGWSFGQLLNGGALVADGRYWLGCDQLSGQAFAVDMRQDSVIEFLEPRPRLWPLRIAAVAINIEERIAEIEQLISIDTSATAVADRRLEIAYLLRTAGRDNDLVALYQGISEEFSESFAAVEAKLGLADIAAQNSLLSQAASYSHNGLLAYGRYLGKSGRRRFLSVQQILTAVGRLKLAPDDLVETYHQNIARAYLSLSEAGPELAEAIYHLGVELHKHDQKALARKCFAEARNQLITIPDPALARHLRGRLDLATGEASARYEVKRRGKEIVVDGVLTEWDRSDPLRFQSDAQLIYSSDSWSGPGDLQGEVYLERNQEYLYVAGSIADDSLVRGDGEDGDYLGIYFDFRASAGDFFTRENSVGRGCFQIYINAPGGLSPKATLSMSVAAPYEVASRSTESGYSFEVALPLAAFGDWFPPQRDRFGLGVELVDYDRPGEWSRANALGFMIPRGGPDRPLNPQLYGYGEL